MVEQPEWDYSHNVLRLRPDYFVHGDDWVTGPDAWIRDNIGGDGLEDLIGASRRLLDPEVLSAYVDIVRLAPNLMRTARVAADLDGFVDTMSQSLREEAAPVGFWGLVTALSDPEIQRGVGRVLLITRHLGRDTKLVPAIRS